MKKFLLTLLFCIFANPIFAQTKPTTKTNLDIKINTKETAESLNNIKNNFTGYISTNLCTPEQKENIKSIKGEEFENKTCGSKTIGETYNCICEKSDQKYENFYKSVEPITTFKELKGTTTQQFTQIVNFYNALDSLPDLMQSVNDLLAKVTELKGQEEDAETSRKARIDVLKTKLAEDLMKKIQEEKQLRKDNTEIVKDLEKTGGLKTHPNKGIKDYMENKENDANKAAQQYVNKVIDDLLKKNPKMDANELENEYNNNEGKDTSETKITEYNIKAITNAQKDKEKAEKDKLLDDLFKLKKDEADLINKVGATQTPAVKVDPITKDNFNKLTTNTNLNNALDKLIKEKSPHPGEAAETIEEINADIENAKKNIEKLKALRDEINAEKNKLDKELEEAYNNIRELLHKQNLKECTLFKAIDHVIDQKIKNYKTLGISGSKITCENLGTKTLEEMKNINDNTTKEKYLKCLQDKSPLIKENITTLGNEITTNNKKLNQFKCSLECPYEGDFNKNPLYENYDIWYETNGTTKTKYKKQSFITIDDQIKKCQLENFECKDDNGTVLKLPSKPTSLDNAKQLCETAKKENKIDNFICQGVSETLNNIVKENTRKELKKPTNKKSIDDILKSECTKAQNITNFKCDGVGQDTLTRIKDNMNKKISQTSLDEILKLGTKECNEAKTIENFSCIGIDQKDLNTIKNQMKSMFNKNPQPSIESIEAFGKEKCSDAQRQAQIDKFTCPGIDDPNTLKTIKANMKAKLTTNPQTPIAEILKGGNEECSDAQTKAQIDNFTCPGITDTKILKEIKAKMTKRLEQTPQPTPEDIKEIENIGKSECSKAQAEAELTQAKAKLLNNFKDMCDILNALNKQESTSVAEFGSKGSSITVHSKANINLSNNMTYKEKKINGIDIAKNYAALVNNYCKLNEKAKKENSNANTTEGLPSCETTTKVAGFISKSSLNASNTISNVFSSYKQIYFKDIKMTKGTLCDYAKLIDEN